MIRWLQHIPFLRWFIPSIGIKRWFTLSGLGVVLFALGFALAFIQLLNVIPNTELPPIAQNSLFIATILVLGIVSIVYGVRQIMYKILAPYRAMQQGDVIDHVVDFNRRKKGFKFVAIGGGTGLPVSLRGMRRFTSNITAIVTVADDGGSSGRLRRDLGVLPPGDIRNNIVALADDTSLLTQLFQYRFDDGDLKGHSFGNLFIAALANIVAKQRGNGHNSLAEALVEVERVLNIEGRVLPSTLEDVVLTGLVNLRDTSRSIQVRGESQIGNVEGTLVKIDIDPSAAEAYPLSVEAIQEADIIVLGPGSLYTSILPNLMVEGIADALRATDALILYVCNVATQPVETEGYSVADHVMALERHIGRGVFQGVIANSAFPDENAGVNTHYVKQAPDNHEILQRYDVSYVDLTDYERPWRHDTNKLAMAILDFAKQDTRIASIIKSTSKELV